MSQRLLNSTKWLLCLLALYASPVWSPVESVTVRNPPKNPSIIEAQAKFFQDFFSVQLSPYKIEFGHVCEDPNTWEQRYEKKDFKNHRDMGKVRWGDKHGGYGEHYWDLNHAGHAGKHGNDGYEGDNDDGSYDRQRYHGDTYEEPNEETPKYDEEYYPEKESNYEEGGRTKRAHAKVKPERKRHVEANYEEESQPKSQKHRNKNKEQLQDAPSHNVEEVSEEETESDEEIYKPSPPPKQKRPQHKKQNHEEQNEDNHQEQLRDQSQYQTTQKDIDAQEQPSQYVPRKQPELTHYVPYERGAGVRQYQPPEYTVAASAPRLFLEPSTGHVVDRATGQAYILQPIVTATKY